MVQTIGEVISLDRNYKRYTAALLIAAAAALVVCAFSLSLKQKTSLAVQGTPQQSYTNYYISKPSPSQEMPETGMSSNPDPGKNGASLREEEYLITIHDGKIGVFRSGESSPFLTADIDVYLLPEKDVDILRSGIRVSGFSAVKSVLEDYE